LIAKILMPPIFAIELESDHALNSDELDKKTIYGHLCELYPWTHTGNHKVKLIFIRHPSAFFSWKKWATVLAQESTLFIDHV